MRRCSVCGEEKDDACFCKKGKGLNPACRDCTSVINKRYHDENRQAVILRKRAYRDKNRGICLAAAAKSRAKSAGIEIDLGLFDGSYFESWVGDDPVCECCGREMRPNRGAFCDDSITIDRIVPSLGYVRGNVAVLCWRCNRIKSNATSDELCMIAIWMWSHGA